MGSFKSESGLGGGGGHYRDRDLEGVELLTAFASSSSSSARKPAAAAEVEPVRGWSAGSASGSASGIGGKHYRDRADLSSGSAHYRDRESSGRYKDPAGGPHYRDGGGGKAGESSGASTPGGVDLPPVKVVYDLARDGIEEVDPPVVGKGKGKEDGEVVVNGKGKERARDDDALKAEEGVEAVDEVGRIRSGSGYEQAARDVEMELMGEL
jgi:hypothetical protein